MITTRNRAEALERTCEIIAALNPPPVEVLIKADGCADDTKNVIRGHLPQATVIINKSARGSVACRDVMMRQAGGDLVFALDDDSYPEQMDCIAVVRRFFEGRPGLAVLHFPQRSDEYPETLSQTQFGPEHLTRSFANSGAVLRRSVYLQLSGLEPLFFHMYEEPDYALQCVAAGYEVLFSPAVTIRHHYSGNVRSEMRNHHRHARNELWSTLLRCPFPFAFGIVFWRVGSQFRYACRRGWSWVTREPAWWWQALAGVPYCLRKPRPVSWAVYKRWLHLS